VTEAETFNPSTPRNHPTFPRPRVFNFSLSMWLLLQGRQMPQANAYRARSGSSCTVNESDGTHSYPHHHSCWENRSLLHTVNSPTPLPHSVYPLFQFWRLICRPLESPHILSQFLAQPSLPHQLSFNPPVPSVPNRPSPSHSM